MSPCRLFFLALAYLGGYIFSITVGGLIVKAVLDRFYVGYEHGRTVENWRAGVVGMVERALYTTSWLLGVPEFIAIWLAFKVAGQWDRWKQDWSSKARADELKAKRDPARATYAGYLIGNALSIAFGITGALVTKRALQFQWGLAGLLALSLTAGVGLLYLNIAHHTAARQHADPPTEVRRRRTTRRK